MNPHETDLYKGLLQDETLMANLIQGLMDTLVVIDRDAAIRFINRAGEELLGYRAADLVGKPIGTIVCDEDLRFFKAVRELMTTGESRRCDLYLVTRSGEKIVATFTGSVLRGPDRQIHAVVGVIRDMREIWELIRELEEAESGLEEKVQARTKDLAEAKTATEKAYENLNATREHLKNVIASVPLGMLILSGDLRVLSTNRFFRNLFGGPDAELRGRPLEEVLPAAGLREQVAEVLAAGVSQRRFTFDLSGQPEERNLQITVALVRYLEGDPARLLLIVEDITYQKRMERRTQRTLDTALDGVVVSDEEGQIVWANPAAETMFGLGGGKLVGQPLDCLIPERYRKRHHEAFLKSGASALFGKRRQLEGLRSNGAEFPLEIVLSGFREDEKWVFTAFIRDRTEERMMGEALEKAYEELQQSQSQLLQSEKMASIGMLAAGVAHEINNPVGFVKSNLGRLTEYVDDLLQLVGGYESLLAVLERGDAGVAAGEAKRVRAIADRTHARFILEDLSRLIGESLDGIERVQQIVVGLKEFSHVDQAERKPFNLNEGLESALKIVWNELKYKAEVVKETGEIPEIVCYPQQLNQVFLNLLVNAGQAIAERNGSRGPGAGSGEKGKIWIRSYARDGHVVVEVEDTGCGIAPEHLKKVFDPFFTTKPVGKGTGLGLSISYGIVQRHRGRIEVKSEVGKGTLFRVSLPVGERLGGRV